MSKANPDKAMRRRTFIWLISVGVILAAIAWFFLRRPPASVTPLAISFVEYTNLYSARAAVFAVSNQWSSAVQLWAEAHVANAPFPPPRNPDLWIRTGVVTDRYIQPGETAIVRFSGPVPDQEWRLLLHCSPGLRAKVALATRKHSALPNFLKVPPGYWVSSDSIRP
jgi:hypothetical protein